MMARLTEGFGARYALLAALAATAAFVFSSLFPFLSAPVAAITALIAVRPTFHESIQEAVRQVAAVVVGGVFALALTQTIGPSPLVLFACILVSFVVARLTRLGDEGAVATAVTVILVLGPSFDAEDVESRFLGVLVGSLFALLVSLYTRPGTPHKRALDATLEEAERTSKLLAGMARALSHDQGRVPLATAQEWLAEAESIVQRVEVIREQAQGAVSGALWSPLLPRQEARAVLEQVTITSSTAVVVVGMCRDMAAAAACPEALPAPLAASLSEVFSATAELIAEQSEAARENPAEMLPPDSDPVLQVEETRKDAVGAIRKIEETQPLLLGGSVLRDAEKITGVLAG